MNNLRRTHSCTQTRGGRHFSNDGWQPLHKVVMLCKVDSQLQPVESRPMEPVLNEPSFFYRRIQEDITGQYSDLKDFSLDSLRQLISGRYPKGAKHHEALDLAQRSHDRGERAAAASLSAP